MQDFKTPAPPIYKKKFSIFKVVTVSFSLLLGAFLVLNHFAAMIVICTSFYSTPYLCQEIGNDRVLTFVTDLMKK